MPIKDLNINLHPYLYKAALWSIVRSAVQTQLTLNELNNFLCVSTKQLNDSYKGMHVQHHLKRFSILFKQGN